jgi:2-C-methyl-D-erythritol 4-phosphate cytidylyltransferase
MTDVGRPAAATDRVALVIVAAGRGSRLGRVTDDAGKALVQVAGRTLLEHALTAFAPLDLLCEVVVVHTPGEEDRFRRVVGSGIHLTPGGETRAASVRAGLAAITSTPDVVAIHDAARAFVPVEVVRRTISAVTGDVIGAAPGVPVVDTVREVDDAGRVVRTVDRASLRTVQTPQVIRADAAASLRDHPELWDGATDDLEAVLTAVAKGDLAGEVVLVDGDRRALKVTRPEDLLIAASLATGQADG